MMDKLEQAVRKSLTGLLLPPLREIVVEYLPDRGILYCFNYSGLLRVEPRPGTTTDWGYCAAVLIRDHSWSVTTFVRKEIWFEPFTFSLNDLSGQYSKITIVYQGEVEIVQIVQWI